MPKFITQSPIEHDLRRYAIGETVELDEQAAAPLLAAGVIVRPAGKGKVAADHGEGVGDA